jgi:hypothetical protein
MNMKVVSIPHEQTHEWLLKNHYAHRIPSISYSFGLYDNNILVGVCTYGSPCRMLNNGYGIFNNKLQVTTLELNRLVINECLPKNTLSYFVSQTFKKIEIPACLISYADSNAGHHGYIYQATNWIYTGITQKEAIYFNKRTNEIMHPRTVVGMFGTRESDKLPDWIEISKEAGGKYRYVHFIGNKGDIKKMNLLMVYPILPYPKGDNQRYDASYEPSTQGILL